MSVKSSKPTAFSSKLTYPASIAAITAVIFVDYADGGASYGDIRDFNGTWGTDSHVLPLDSKVKICVIWYGGSRRFSLIA
ncbi:MAG: hypothetical protein C7B43_16365 [Sulfobacillus benefaciens]|uniref:Uncharacterized protein n=1 Tax=Sulfobacillus benefaciens TaxID=453960 RepID=A0A2T2WTP6_9FIRM|nr:MAG: hypothetical protein C7B43_16365 [Sulfobacillus benefaciens]